VKINIDVIKPAREELKLVRFMFDEESKKTQLEAANNKYNSLGKLMSSEPIRLCFRGEEYENIKQRCFKNLGDEMLQLFVEKIKKDRE
jgi:hypothetical protein